MGPKTPTIAAVGPLQLGSVRPLLEPSMGPQILIVDDDPSTILLLGQIVAEEGTVRFATTGAEGMRLARTLPPDLILLDAELPDVDGFRVCSELKRDVAFGDVPIVFVSSHREEEFELAGLRAGASDFIGKPIHPRLVLERARAQLRVKRMSDQLRKMATIDPLTGIANRRRWDEAVELEWRRARRAGRALSLGFVDVDHFKTYNDHYGHTLGDVCLRTVAKALTGACLRPADLVARFGGEEFSVLLPETAEEGAEHLARRVLSAIDELGIPHAASPTAHVLTVSVGMATYTPARPPLRSPSSLEGSPAALAEAADRALYSAKRAGRARAHRIHVHEEHVGMPEPLALSVLVQENA
jgi:diguanylate cyclase (GGDEF)-like protein